MLFVPSTDRRYLSLEGYQQAEDIIEEEEVKTEGTKEKHVRFDTDRLVSTRIFVRVEEERPSLLRRLSKATASCFRSRECVALCLVILGMIAFGFSRLILQSLDGKNLEARVSPFMGNNTTLFRVMPNATNLTTTLPTAEANYTRIL